MLQFILTNNLDISVFKEIFILKHILLNHLTIKLLVF